MTDRSIPIIRQRFLEDMRIKGLQSKTQTMYMRAMRDFIRFLGRSPDTAKSEDLLAFQLDMSEKCTETNQGCDQAATLNFCVG